MRIKLKIALLFIALSLITIGIVSMFFFSQGKKIIEQKAINHLITTNESKKEKLEIWIKNNFAVLESIRELPVFQNEILNVIRHHDGHDPNHLKMHQKIKGYLSPFISTDSFLEIFITDPADGRVAFSSDSLQEDKYKDDQPFFKQGKEKPFFQDIVYDAAANEPTMIISVPLFDSNQVPVAILASKLDMNLISDIFERRNPLSPTEDSYLVNKFNYFITEPRFGHDYAFKKTIHTQSFEEARKKGQYIGKHIDYRQTPVLGEIRWLPKWKLLLVTKMDLAEAEAPVNELKQTVFLIALLLSIAAAVVGWFLSSFITRPIDALKTMTQQISQGELNVDADIGQKGEFYELAKSFSNMAENLQATMVSKVELEQEIEIRKKTEKDLKISEQKYIDLYENAPDMYVSVDSETALIQRCNQTLAAVLGYEKSEILDRPIFDMYHPDSIENAQKAFQTFVETGEVNDAVMQLQRKDGTPMDVSLNMRTIKDDRGRIIQSRSSWRDITERIESEKKIAQYTAKLKQSNEDLQQFAYVASHDLQEPLRMVSSFTQLLADRYKDQLDEKANKWIDFAVDGANRMQTLIQDLLKFSRVKAHGSNFEEMDMNQAVHSAMDNLNMLIKETSAMIDCQNLPRINADESQMALLFQNLINNAIKFCKNRTPEIYISAEKEDKQWVFSVKDNGIGIESEFIDKIFIIFQRLHSREEFPGTGLGLAVCKRIVQRHHGTIWVESEYGKGSVFYFSIPV